MSVTSSAPVRSTRASMGPGRFQEPKGPEPHGGRLAALGAGLALLGIVVGVPALLLWLSGVPPLPTSVPGREALTQALEIETVLGVMLWVVWLAWLQFTVCVVVELVSALRGVGLPARVPLAGPSQRAARTLVATLLLVLTVSSNATALVPQAGLSSVATPTSVSTTQLAPAAGPGAAASVTADAAVVATSVHGEAAGPTAVASPMAYFIGDMEVPAETAGDLVGRSVYVVEPPEGRYHDNLWDIAERTLGDGRRYQEIFDLNAGREQPDGQELSLARLIQPGWVLIVPDDAVGVQTVSAVAVDSSLEVGGDQGTVAPPLENGAVEGQTVEQGGSEDAGTGVGGAGTTETGGVGALENNTVENNTVENNTVENGTTGDGSGGSHAAGDSGEIAVDGTWDVSGSDVSPGVLSTQGLLGAGLLAGSLLAAIESLRRRRRPAEPSDAAIDAEVALRIGADPARTDRLNRTLRSLTQFASVTGQPLPGVYAVRVSDDTVELALSPAEPLAPAPWTALDDGRRWSIDDGAIARLPESRAAAPFPGLVSLGQDVEHADILVDLEAAQGIIAVVGDPVAARELVSAFAAELVTSPWSDELRVTGVDLPRGLSSIGSSRYLAAGDARAWFARMRGRVAETSGENVLRGRLGREDRWVPDYLLVGGQLDATLAAQVQDGLDRAGRSPFAVVVLGPDPHARWTLTADASGSVSLDVLGLNLTANRFPDTAVGRVAELFQEDDGSAPAPQPSRETLATGTDLERFASAPVRIHILGAAHVQAPGPVEPDRRELLTELVVHLALYPQGVHPTVLGAALWPRGVTREVVGATIDRARTWLGTDGAGTPHLRQTPEGLLLLGPEVGLDWSVVEHHLAQAEAARAPETETAHLRDAMRVVRGGVLAGRPGHRYSWLARVRLERSARIRLVAASHRLAVLEAALTPDPTAALAALGVGHSVDPVAEVLWRERIRLAHRSGGPDGVRAVAAELDAALAAVQTPQMEPETRALLEELVPGQWSRSVPA